MSDHGALLTQFESMFGSQMEHEVIKIVLQSCNWDPSMATEKLLGLVDVSEPCASEDKSLQNDSPSSNESDDHESSPPPISAWCGPPNPTIYTPPTENSRKTAKKHDRRRNSADLDAILCKIEGNSQIMIILRGLPGSGKSSLANKLRFNGSIHSTDFYFIDAQGRYKFDPQKISDAHELNKQRAKHSLECSISPVIIDNTNLEVWEMEPYVQLALDFGYYVEILEPQTPWRYNPRELFKKCTHGVPQKKIEVMKERFQRNVKIESMISKLRRIKDNQEIVAQGIGNLRLTMQNEEDEDVVIEDSDVEQNEGWCCTNSSQGLVLKDAPKERDLFSLKGNLDSNDINKCPDVNDLIYFSDCIIPNSKELKGSENVSNGVSSCDIKETSSISNDDSNFSINSANLSPRPEASETNYNDSYSNSICKNEFNDLVGHLQSSMRKQLNNNNMPVINKVQDQEADFTADGFSSDKELYEFCHDYESKTGNSILSSVNVVTYKQEEELNDEKDGLSWDNVSPTDVNLSWSDGNAASKKSETSEFGIRERRRPKGDPDKWINYAQPQEPLDPSIESWVPVEPEKMNWEASDEENYTEAAQIDSAVKNLEEHTFVQEHSYSKFNDSSTQSCLSDFVSTDFEKSRILDGDPMRFQPADAFESLFTITATRGKLKLDKSCMTQSESCSLSPSDCLIKLTNLFPSIPKNQLKSLFNKCDDDIDWTVDLLIDSGYLLEENLDSNDPLTSSSDSEIYGDEYTSSAEDLKADSGGEFVKKKIKQSSMPELLKHKRDIETSFSLPKDIDDRVKRLTGKEYEDLHIHKLKQRNNHATENENKPSLNLPPQSDADDKEGAQYLTLTLDPLFASQLGSIFGPVGSMSMNGEFSNEDRNVVLPLELCHQIYCLWSQTLDGKFVRETQMLDNFIKTDEELARKLQEEEEQKTKNLEHQNTNKIDQPTSFQEIMDIEKALSMSTADSVDASTYSYTFKLQSLCNEFKGVDKTVIENELSANLGNYHKVRALLEFRYGSRKNSPENLSFGVKPKNLTRDDSYREAEEDEDIIPDNPQAFRGEAQMYYQEREKAFEGAQRAAKNGMVGVAAYYAHLGNLHTQKFREANERAANKILEAFNATKDANTLDLHLLHVPEALKAVQSFLSERKKVLVNRNLKHLDVFIITGQGKNSSSGQSVLKPSVSRFLKKSGYNFSDVRTNRGMLVVKLVN